MQKKQLELHSRRQMSDKDNPECYRLQKRCSTDRPFGSQAPNDERRVDVQTAGHLQQACKKYDGGYSDKHTMV
jgi:hypothetical protein